MCAQWGFQYVHGSQATPVPIAQRQRYKGNPKPVKGSLKGSFQSGLNTDYWRNNNQELQKGHVAISEPCWFDKKNMWKGCICAHSLTYCLNSEESLTQPESQVSLYSALNLSYTPQLCPMGTQNLCSSPGFMMSRQDSSPEQMLLCTCFLTKLCPGCQTYKPTAPLCSPKYLSQHSSSAAPRGCPKLCRQWIAAAPQDALWTLFVQEGRAPTMCAEGGNEAEGRQVFVSSFIHCPGDMKQQELCQFPLHKCLHITLVSPLVTSQTKARN